MSPCRQGQPATPATIDCIQHGRPRRKVERHEVMHQPTWRVGNSARRTGTLRTCVCDVLVVDACRGAAVLGHQRTRSEDRRQVGNGRDVEQARWLRGRHSSALAIRLVALHFGGLACLEAEGFHAVHVKSRRNKRSCAGIPRRVSQSQGLVCNSAGG